MKMAKASEADLQMAMDLTGMLDALGHRLCPSMPTVIARNGGDEEFDRNDDAQCGRALRVLLETADRASLGRVVWGAAVMLDPRNRLVDPAADTIEQHPDRVHASTAAKALRAALAELHRVCLGMDLENQAERPTEAEYQTAMTAAAAALQLPEVQPCAR